MKKLVYLTIYAALVAGSGGLAIADNANASPGLVAREIQLHAPNSPEQTVTVWVPATPVKPASEWTTGPHGATKVINLPAGNGPEQSITVWVDDKYQKTAFYQAK